MVNNRFLTPDDIAEMIPRNVITYVIKGIKKDKKLSISVMLDKDEKDPELSLKTGKLYITDPQGRAPLCALLRSWPDATISDRCPNCDRAHFDKAKKKVLSNSSYKGEIYWCSSGCLKDFIVPIVEKESNTFIGAIFGGQKRLKEHPWQAWKRLKNFIAEPDNRCLASIPFWKLYWNYLKVEQVTEEELREMKSKCEKIADELAKQFELLVQIKKEDYERRVEQDAINNISKLLITARDFHAFCGSMDGILNELQKWLRFDWGMILAKTGTQGGEDIFEVRGIIGRGIGPHQTLRRREFNFPSEAVRKITRPQRYPDFLDQYINSIVPGEPEYWWIPLITNENKVFGAIVFGSAPKHRNTQYNSQHIQEHIQSLNELAGRIAVKYGELKALEREKQKTAELEESRRKLEKTINTLGDTLLGLTHQLKRPLVMVQAMLSNVRDDIYLRFPRHIMEEHLDLGISIVKHTELMCKGVSKVFAVEGGGEFDHKPELIDVKAELKALCEALKRASGRKDLSFAFFGESPTIVMDKESFLYVFYVLIDNAIKYSDPHTKISLVCAKERTEGTYAIKVKSIGLPIEPHNKSRVFEKFWRHPRAYQYDDAGIGLGCWAAREHMKRQGGDITLEVDGRLSVFIVYPPKQIYPPKGGE